MKEHLKKVQKKNVHHKVLFNPLTDEKFSDLWKKLKPFRTRIAQDYLSFLMFNKKIIIQELTTNYSSLHKIMQPKVYKDKSVNRVEVISNNQEMEVFRNERAKGK